MLSALYAGTKVGVFAGSAVLGTGLVLIAGLAVLEIIGTKDWIEEREQTRCDRVASKIEAKKAKAKDKAKAKAKKVKAKASRLAAPKE